MSTIDDKLNEVLNIADEVLEKKEEKNPLEVVNEAPKPVAPENDEVETDFDSGRNELYKLLDKGNTAIDGILNLAKELATKYLIGIQLLSHKLIKISYSVLIKLSII